MDQRRSAPRGVRSLVTGFAVLSLTAFLIMGASLHFLVAGQVRSRYQHLAESRAVLRTHDLTRDLLASLASPADPTLPVSREALVPISDALAGNAANFTDVIGISVWKLDGTVLASDDPLLVGRVFPERAEELRRILQNGVKSEVVKASSPDTESPRATASRILETFIPIRTGDETGGPLAVAQLDQDYARTEAAISSALRKEDTVLVTGLLLLWLPLLLMVYGTGRTMRAQATSLEERETTLRAVSAGRDRAEVALKESEARFRVMFEGAAVGVALVDTEGRIIDSNPALQDMLGHGADELRGRTFADFTHEEDIATNLALFRELISGARDHYQLEKRYRRKDGHFWGQLTASVVRDASGAPRLGIGMVENIETRKRAEDALRQAYAQEREAADRLRALDEVKSGILTAVSHELRTPLAAVLGYALTLHERRAALPDEVAEEFAERLVVKAKKLDRLLSDLLDLDRLVRGVIEPRRRRTNLATLVRRVADEVDVGEHALRIEADDATVAVDSPRVERIVENLIANAAKYAPEGSVIRVRVGPYRDGALIAVDDAGPGIPPEEKDLIFEPFQRGRSSPDHAPGTGVGLSLVAQFAELHGGRVWVEDNDRGGSSFCVYLPSAASGPEEPEPGDLPASDGTRQSVP